MDYLTADSRPHYINVSEKSVRCRGRSTQGGSCNKEQMGRWEQGVLLQASNTLIDGAGLGAEPQPDCRKAAKHAAAAHNDSIGNNHKPGRPRESL